MKDFSRINGECEAQLQAILRVCGDIVLLLDKNLNVLWASEGARSLSPTPVGSSCAQLFCDDDDNCLNCNVAQAFRLGHRYDVTVKSIVKGRKNNDNLYSINCSPVLSENAETSQVVIVARDITERLHLLRQVRQSTKMEAIGTLAGGIAHDFNNILTPIMGYAEMLRLNFSADSVDRRESLSFIDQILEAAKRAQKLIQQILVFSRNVDSEENAMPIHPVVKEGLKLISATFPATIDIKQEIDENCGLLKIDPLEIHQILINLCKNAADAMAGQGGELMVSLKREDGSPAKKKKVALTVADTGVGIEDNMLGRIFEPYFTTKEKIQGTGMGLAIVHGIVSRYGGEIDVKSEVGRGTTVTVSLPILEESPEMRKGAEPESLSGSGQHILLVDDEKQVVETTSAILRRLGYNVTPMTCARKSLHVFAESNADIDLVIADYAMPYLTGVDLCRKMKELRPNLPVILYSGGLEDLDIDVAAKAGIDGFCMKPVTMSELSRIVQEVLA